jgi:long-chain acyl-CoA synthetase
MQLPRISQVFERTVEKFPDHLAVVEGDLRWTYAQLRYQSQLVEERLRAGGVTKGDRVILWLKNSSLYIAAYLAVLELEAVVVAVHSDATISEVLKIISHVEAIAMVITSAKWDKNAEEFRQSGLRLIVLPESSLSLCERIESRASPDGLAQILYTSGTTGNPKGVMLSHDNLIANVESILARLPLGSSDSTVAVLPFVFSYGNSVLLSHLFSGVKIVIQENLAFAHCVVDSIKKEAATGFSGVASHYAFLLRDSGFRSGNLPSLRYLTSAGGPMPQKLLAKVREAIPNAAFHVMYGQTEAAARITMLSPDDLERKSGSAGRPIPGTSVRIVNDRCETLPACMQGEIVVAGGNVMEGYWRDQDSTAAKLKNGWLFTGDLGYLDDEGFLFITGRKSEMIKTGGFRVSPEEIEKLLLEHEDVLDVGVAGVEDEPMGQVIVVGMVPKGNTAFSARTLMAYCATHMAPFKRPRAIYCLERIPRSANGKILRRALEVELSALHRDPAPQLLGH